MQRTNDFFLRHAWAPIALGVLAATAVTWLLFPGNSLLATALRACLYSVAGAAVVMSRRRKEKNAAGGSTDRLIALEHSLRTGEPPTAPEDRRALREIVERRLHQGRHRVAALVFLAVLFTAVTVLTGLTGITAGLPRTIALAALSALFLAWTAWNSNRQTHRLHTMRTALHTDEAPAGPGPA
ncbi:hypothetical protein [Streptomyces bauhiniae]|uniref:Uncharacterized protein n=1 Tax=Streptomyces bauhiniae TaxID=2340725 RepID=A0A7K3QXX2_9ACTN|nr:hypothetical protein [Streptomyces bauhiniae]NEB94686.1 hypothetical protein [Streptomyces bauhiniae]